MNDIFEKTYITESGQEIFFQSGKLAFRSNGSLIVKCGKTVILVVLTYDDKETKEYDFLPLHVDYQEKYYSVGKIPTNNTKREGKLNDHEILISRLIDRCIRPIINPNFKKAIDINVVLLSHDKEVAIESIACFGTSIALMIAGVPIITCVSECIATLQDGKWIINASPSANPTARLIVGGNEHSTTMLEGSANEISKETLIEGISLAMDEIKRQCEFQLDFIKEIKGDYNLDITAPAENNVDERLKKDILSIFAENIKCKNTRDKKINSISANYQEKYDKSLPKVLKATCKEALQDILFSKDKRIDGRSCDEIRDITCEVGILPSAHGSSLFTRGETQALVTVTLGDRRDSQIKECATNNGYNDFFLHYNFPNYSVGEVGTKSSVGRREIGHGNLALNGVKQTVKKDDLDNYTIRICSDILCSNGSSSMATVCGSSLALMDAGIKVERSVAGIAMGILFDNKNENYKILTDISADEDELGDMDFKVVATEKGINAIQLDVKKIALTPQLLQNGLEEACKGINIILKKMSETISISRDSVRDFAPAYKNIEINRKLIGQIIGIGGNNIQKIQKESNCFIFIEDKRDGGIVRISAPNKASLDKCIEKINFIIESNPVIGNVYDGKVIAISHSGVRVEFLPKKIGLLKINDIDWCEIPNINEVLHINDRISVKLMEDYGEGKYLLSHKVLIENPNCTDNIEKKSNDTHEETTNKGCQNLSSKGKTNADRLSSEKLNNQNTSTNSERNEDELLKSMIPDNI